jgi:hypothetical protein
MRYPREVAAIFANRRNDAHHASRDVTCNRCHDHRAFYAFIAPDPERRAEVRVERMATAWLAQHPCVATYATSARKMTRGAAA